MFCSIVGCLLESTVARSVLTAPVHADPVDNQWLDDFETVPRQTNYDEGMQADSPIDGVVLDSSYQFEDDDVPKCPTLRPMAAGADKCSTVGTECQSDADCAASRRKCCFNGCRRLCTVPVQPPPYIDWKREPQTRLASGRSWLIQGSDIDPEVEWCSTSYDYNADTDSEPLLCPHGYMCHIEDPGDVDNGVPNRGRCILEPADTFKESGIFRMTVLKAAGGVCAIAEKIYKDGETFLYGRHSCTCEDSSVMCHVGKKLALRQTSTSATTSNSRKKKVP